jgi:hypothetical protein
MPAKWTITTENSLKSFDRQKSKLMDLCRRIDAEQDFTFNDWEILFHTLENYRPDFILEVGRGAGNTTCVLLDHCIRHPAVDFCSIDLYDNWHMHSTALLPREFLEKVGDRKLLHQDFFDFDLKFITDANWEKLLLFWDVNDVRATERLTSEFLPKLAGRNLLVAVHDVGFKTGRPQRYHWGQYESLYPDLEIIGRFLDKYKWPAAVPDVEHIFGQYRNAGHWLLFESVLS